MIRKIIKKIDYLKIITIISLIIVPFLFVALTIVKNNYYRFGEDFVIISYVMFYLYLFILLICVFELIYKKRLFGKNIFRSYSFLFFALFYIFEITGIVGLVYYDNNFKEWLITSSASSVNYKYVADYIYDKETIEDTLSSIESKVDLSDDIKNFDINYEQTIYTNEAEEQILKHDDNQTYKIVKINGTCIGSNYTYYGYMVIVYDVNSLKLAKSIGAGENSSSYGQRLDIIAKENNAVVAINGGGFYDPGWRSNGGIPAGPMVIDGELVTNFKRGNHGGGLIGIDNNNKLVLKPIANTIDPTENMKYAVDFGPFLIVNGKNKFKNVKTYSWATSRTAIGQREDGTIIFLVIDGARSTTRGASYADLAAIFEKYGVVNAANLDGGTSTALVEDGKFVNVPWNGKKETKRRLPNAWIITK